MERAAPAVDAAAGSAAAAAQPGAAQASRSSIEAAIAEHDKQWNDTLSAGEQSAAQGQ